MIKSASATVSLLVLLTVISPHPIFADIDCDITVAPGQSIETDGIDQARPGDTICVSPGTYTEVVWIEDKSDLTIIGLSGDNNQPPILSGDNNTPKGNKEMCWKDSCGPPSGIPRCVTIAAEKGLFHLQSSQNITIQNFEIRDSNGAGVIVSNSRNIVIDNNDIHHSQHMGLKVKNSSQDVTISNNQNHHNNMFAPAPRSAGCRNWPQSFGANGTNGVVKNILFLNNKVYNNWGEGIGLFDDVEDSQVIGNEIYNNHSTNLYTNNARKLVIANNFVHYDVDDQTYWRAGKNPSDCLSFGAESTKARDAYDSDFHIYNNIFSNCGDLNQFTVSETQKELDRIVFEHNIFHNPYKPDNTGIAFKLGSNTQQQVLFRNNLIIVDNDNLLAGGDATRAKFYNNIWTTQPNQKFTSPADVFLDSQNLRTRDIWLQTGNDDQIQYFLPTAQLASLSTATYPAEPQYLPSNYQPVTTDYFGCRRDAQPDIGAIEYGATNCEVSIPITPVQIPTATPTVPTSQTLTVVDWLTSFLTDRLPLTSIRY